MRPAPGIGRLAPGAGEPSLRPARAPGRGEVKLPEKKTLRLSSAPRPGPTLGVVAGRGAAKSNSETERKKMVPHFIRRDVPVVSRRRVIALHLNRPAR